MKRVALILALSLASSSCGVAEMGAAAAAGGAAKAEEAKRYMEIGRASCRERV